MTRPQRPAPEFPPPASEAEATARLDAARAELDALVPEARALVAKRSADARARIAHAREQLATWEAARAQLQRHRAHPEGAIHARRADCMAAMYAAMDRMMAIELAALEATGLALAVEGVPAWGDFKNPADDLSFHEQRRRMVGALLGFLWSMNEAGARVVLAAVIPGEASPEAAAVREAAARELAVERLLHTLADELGEAAAAAAWADGAWQGWDARSPEARRTLLKDPRWGDVEGAIALLEKLYGRLGGNPTLTRLFPKPTPFELPYGPPVEAKLPGKAAAPPGPPGGHDQVSLSSGRATSIRLGEPPPGKR